jgi:hypothetical protein
VRSRASPREPKDPQLRLERELYAAMTWRRRCQPWVALRQLGRGAGLGATRQVTVESLRHEARLEVDHRSGFFAPGRGPTRPRPRVPACRMTPAQRAQSAEPAWARHILNTKPRGHSGVSRGSSVRLSERNPCCTGEFRPVSTASASCCSMSVSSASLLSHYPEVDRSRVVE